jgi:hypothetical protein
MKQVIEPHRELRTWSLFWVMQQVTSYLLFYGTSGLPEDREGSDTNEG